MNKPQINIKLGGLPLSILTCIFIYLKVTNQIDWNWFWVLSPTLIPIMILCVFFGLFLGALSLWAILSFFFK
jgi:cell division protein FtsX